jgi:hypothetical protein
VAGLAAQTPTLPPLGALVAPTVQAAPGLPEPDEVLVLREKARSTVASWLLACYSRSSSRFSLRQSWTH